MKYAFRLLLPLLAAALPAAAGLTDLDNPGPSVVSVTARQRYPWNGLVDVDVAFEGNAGETYRIELSATDKAGGTNLPVRSVAIGGGEQGNPVSVPGPGAHRLVWNAAADLPAGFTADRVTVTAKLLNPIWSFDSIPAIDPDDEWAPETVYHDIQTVVSYGEIEDHSPIVRCLTDEWNLESSLGANVVFSGSSMGLRKEADDAAHRRGVENPVALWTWSDATNLYRLVTLDCDTGHIAFDIPARFLNPGSDARFFSMRDSPYRQFLNLSRGDYDDFFKSSNTDLVHVFLKNWREDDAHGSAVCGYFPNGIPVSDSSTTSVSSYDKAKHAAVFFSGEAGTDMKEAVLACGDTGSISVPNSSKYSCMGNPVGRYVVPLLDGNTFFTIACAEGLEFVPQHFRFATGRFGGHNGWIIDPMNGRKGWNTDVARSKAVAMPDGRSVFFGGAGRWTNGAFRMWNNATNFNDYALYPTGHPFESWARRDVTCLLPNGKFCGVDEELGLVVVNPLTGETYVASDDPVFKKGKMGCQLLPNGKVWIIPYDCEGREFEAGLDLCGKLYEVDFGFTRSFSLSSLCSPYLKVAEGDPEPSGIKVGLDPNGGSLPGIYAQYYKGENPVYGELPVPTRTGYAFLGWSTAGTAATLVAASDPVPALGILLKAAWGANGYTVQFIANGGSGTMADQHFVYDTPQALSRNAFTRTGHSFSGWATSANGIVVNTDGQVVKNMTAIPGNVLKRYAVWTPNGYTVKFNANGGSGTMSNQSFKYGTAQALTANAFTRTGYTFGGWATSSTGVKAYNDKQSVSNLTATSGGTVNLYAAWTPNGYTVKFNANGGSGTMSNQSFKYGTAQALTANAFTRTGYTFGGWATSATGAKAYNDKQSVSNLTSTSGGTVNLYAVWTPIGYTVKFNANGGSGTMSNQSYQYGTAQALTANAFTRTGYTFGGWATSATGAKAYNDKQTVSNLTTTSGGTVNLHAVWTPIGYTVKFNANGGSGTMSNQSFKYGTAQALTANAFTRTGYTFGGWATSATGAKAYNDKQSVSNLTTTSGGTVNLYAVWTQIGYTVKFNANGGSGTMSNQSFQYGTAQALTANAFTRTGYTFGGWATSATGAKAYSDKQSVSNLTATSGGTVNLYAVWTLNGYTVKFNANGGSGTMANQSFKYGTAQALTANAFTRTGYAFTGWATSATGAKAYNDKQSVSNLTSTSGGTVNLYAVWTPITYTIRFNANGGTGAMSDMTVKYDQSVTLTANVFTRSGYAYDGWAVVSYQDAIYRDRASVKNLASTQGSIVTLYAVWAKTTDDRLYMIVDLSRGSSASSYPVSYLADVPSGGWTEEYQTKKLVLRHIYPGTFNMGSPSTELGRASNESLHEVTLTQSFYIGVFACSQKQWELVTGANPMTYNPQKIDNWVQREVSFNDIRGSSQGSRWPESNAVDGSSFIGRLRARTGLSFDLPTEAQWEYACRAGTSTAYNLGLDLPSLDAGEVWRFVSTNGIARCSYGVMYMATPSGVAIGTPNAWGLYAMHGNTWEWCLDWYSNLGTGNVMDPVGPVSGSSRVLRGSSSIKTGDTCRSARRTSVAPSYRFEFDGTMDYSTEFVGFRICLPEE